MSVQLTNHRSGVDRPDLPDEEATTAADHRRRPAGPRWPWAIAVGVALTASFAVIAVTAGDQDTRDTPPPTDVMEAQETVQNVIDQARLEHRKVGELTAQDTVQDAIDRALAETELTNVGELTAQDTVQDAIERALAERRPAGG